MAEVIVRSDRVLIYTEDKDAAKDLSRALDQLGISHQLILFDGYYNMVRFFVTEPQDGSN